MLHILHCCISGISCLCELIPANGSNDNDGIDNNNQTHLIAKCFELECPELKCKNVIQKEGQCCKSCDISG